MTSKKRVLIATPSYDGKLDIFYIDSLLNTISLAEQNNIEVYPFFICYDSLIQRARNDLFKTAYLNGLDVLFFIDGDIGWKAQDFFKLVNSDKDIIGGSYRKKTDDKELYVVKALDDNDPNLNLNIDEKGILEVAGIGCGFMKISRKAMETLWNCSKSYKSEKDDSRMIFEVVCENNDLISEDIYMCKKWRDMGNSVYLDTNITCSHTGTKTFIGNVNNWLNSFKKPATESTQAQPDISKYFTKAENDDDFKVIV
jgi:hypothetical protein